MDEKSYLLTSRAHHWNNLGKKIPVPLVQNIMTIREKTHFDKDNMKQQDLCPCLESCLSQS